MSQSYIGEIRMFGGSFAPAGWAFCDGQLMPISENDALFTLLGTTFGGDGQETFGLPDLRGRAPIHQGTLAGNTYTWGEEAGVETVTLNTQQLPVHNHALVATTNLGNQSDPTNNVLVQNTSIRLYIEGVSPDTNMNANSVSQVGGSQPHENMQPFLTVSFIISLFGVFPSPT